MHLLFLAGKTLIFRRGSFALLLIAIAGALGLQIANTANLEGYSRELFTKGIVFPMGHVIVTPREPEPLGEATRLIAALGKNDFIGTVAPRFAQPGVLFAKGLHHPVNAIGIDPAAEENANRLCSRVGQGACYSANATDELMVGHRLAEKLELRVGQSVQLVLPVEELDNVRYVKHRFTVVGILAPSGGFSVLEYGTYLRIAELRAIVDWPDAVTSLNIYLRDAEFAPRAAPLLQQQLGDRVRVQAWAEFATDVVSGIESNQTINRISQAMVILAVLFPTLAMLWISVIREQRQIAALLAIGFTRRAIFAVYLLRAALVAAAGTAIGATGGVLLCRWFQGHPIYAHHGFIVKPVLSAASCALSVSLVFAVTLLGGLLPALQAAWSNPALTLRGD